MKTSISTKPLPPLPKSQKVNTYAKIANEIKTGAPPSQRDLPSSNSKPRAVLTKNPSKHTIENLKLENQKNPQHRPSHHIISVRNSTVIDNKSLPIHNPSQKKYAKAIPAKNHLSATPLLLNPPAKTSSRQDLSQKHKSSNSNLASNTEKKEKESSFFEVPPKFTLEFEECGSRFCSSKNEVLKNTGSTTGRGVSDFPKGLFFDKDDSKKNSISPFNERSFLETTQKSQVTCINDGSVSDLKLKTNKEVSIAFSTLTQIAFEFRSSMEKRKGQVKRSRHQVLKDLRMKVGQLELRNIERGFLMLQRAVDQFQRSRKRVAMKKLLITFKN